MRALRASVHALTLAGLSACDPSPADTDAASLDVAVEVDSGPPDTGAPPPFELTSSAYENGGVVPLRHECAPPLIPDGPGENISPPLAWSAGPATTMSYALVMRDRDAGDLVHWVLYDIPPDVREIAEDMPSGYSVTAPAGAHQAEIQGSGYFGYFGPCSPGRVNPYGITLHAHETGPVPGVHPPSREGAIPGGRRAASIASTTLSGES